MAADAGARLAGLQADDAPHALDLAPVPVDETPLRWDLTKQRMEVDAQGNVSMPEGPGLGVDLDENAIERYRVRTPGER